MGGLVGGLAGGRRRRGRRQRLQAFSTYNGRDRIPLSRDGGLQRLRQVTRLAWDKEAGGKAQGGGKRKAGGMRERRGRKAKRNETKYKKKISRLSLYLLLHMEEKDVEKILFNNLQASKDENGIRSILRKEKDVRIIKK